MGTLASVSSSFEACLPGHYLQIGMFFLTFTQGLPFALSEHGLSKLRFSELFCFDLITFDFVHIQTLYFNNFHSI